MRTAEMQHAIRVVMLISDGFGGFGGIAKFNRDFLGALGVCPSVEGVYVLPRLIPEPITETIPESIVYDRKAARGKLAFVGRAWALARSGDRIDVVVCGHLHLLLVAWLLARLRNAQLTLVIHGIEAWKPSRHMLANRLARSVDEVIAVSRYSAERFASWSKASTRKVFVLPNCVDLDHFRPDDRDPALVSRYGVQSSKVILTVGRLVSKERYKGFDEVIEAMPKLLRRFPTLKYLIVGGGHDRQRLEEKAQAGGIADKVIFAGQIAESEKVAHYNLADAYVMPSLGEGFGIVLIEAAACGIPVIGSNADGSREALLGGRLGRLVDPRAAPQLVDAVAAALDSDAPHERLPGIETFDVAHFRRNVATWARQHANGTGSRVAKS